MKNVPFLEKKTRDNRVEGKSFPYRWSKSYIITMKALPPNSMNDPH